MNTTCLTGRLGNNPELKYFDSGKVKASFSIAVKGKKKDEAHWINIEAWDKTAELSKLYYIDYYNRQSDDFKDKNTMDDYLKENYNGIVTFFSSVIIDGDWISDIDKVELEIIITNIKNSKNESMAVAVIDYHN